MLTTNEIATLKAQFTASKNEEALATLITLEQTVIEFDNYKQLVLKKVATIESDMERLVAESERHLNERESAFVERDSCISVLVKMAMKLGHVAGVKDNNVVLELGSGQVSWDFLDAEAHLFEDLPPYTKPIEELDMQEKYTRVMNAGIL